MFCLSLMGHHGVSVEIEVQGWTIHSQSGSASVQTPTLVPETARESAQVLAGRFHQLV